MSRLGQENNLSSSMLHYADDTHIQSSIAKVPSVHPPQQPKQTVTAAVTFICCRCKQQISNLRSAHMNCMWLYPIPDQNEEKLLSVSGKTYLCASCFTICKEDELQEECYSDRPAGLQKIGIVQHIQKSKLITSHTDVSSILSSCTIKRYTGVKII